MARLRLAHGPEANQLLTDPSNDVFAYRVNKPVLGFMLTMGILFIVIAIAWVFLNDFKTAENIGVVIVLGIASLYFGGRGLHWRQFADEHKVIIHPERLVFGTEKRAWSVAWDLLDTQSVGLEQMELSKLKARLEVRVAKEKIDIVLFSALVHLVELERFMGTVLEHVALAENDHDDSEE